MYREDKKAKLEAKYKSMHTDSEDREENKTSMTGLNSDKVRHMVEKNL